VRNIRIVLAFTALIISASSVRGATEAVLTDRLEQQLREAHYVRIGIDGRTHVLTKPRALPEGLRYEQVEKFPRRRYDMLAGADTVPPPSNPVPWSRIEQIETGDRSRGRGALISGTFGFLIGAGLGAGLALWASSSESEDWDQDSWEVTLSSGAIFGLIGAGIGALVPSTRWKQVYPQPQR
jgi:hypothetical protein